MIAYQITQLTDNTITDIEPQISGNNIVWTGNDGNDDEIFLYDGETIIQLTDNDLFDFAPAISGNNLVWSASTANPLVTPLSNGSIFFYDGNTTTKLADVGGVLNSAISGNNIVWGDLENTNPSNIEDENFGNSEVFFYNGSDTIKLGNSSLPAFLANSISENNVVWAGNEANDPNDIEVFFYDGSNTTQITNNNLIESFPITSGNNIAWTSSDASRNESSFEVFFYDGSNTIQLTENNFTDLATSISGDNLVWVGNDGNDNEIFLYNGETTIQLTDNETDDTNAVVSGNNVVWAGNDGSDYEIFLYDGETTTQLTDNEINDIAPRVSGNNITWSGDEEIFLATPSIVNNEPIAETETKLYRFRNTAFDTGTYLFVGEAEGNSILADANLSQTFELEGVQEDGSTNSAFVASTEPGDDLIPFYRIRSLDVPGTYLFVSNAEYDAIFANNSPQRDKWIQEGSDRQGNDIPEFYLYEGGAERGLEFNRFQNTQNNTFLYAGPEETANINNDPGLSALFNDQGIAFESLT
jgi:beta propeller repeat protein